MESGKALDAVGALMRERQKYEGWLEALIARRETAPSRVFERVHADYVARLEGVMRQLGEHAPVLAEQASTLDSRLGSLASQEGDLRDQRAEAELRSVVGELTPEEWDAFSRDSDDALTALAEEQGRLRDELTQVRELLSAATTPARALTPVEPTPVTEAPAADEPAPAAAALAAPAAPEQAPDERATATAAATHGGDEPAGAAVETPPALEGADETPAVVVGAAEPAAAAGTGSPFDELAFLESVSNDAAAAAAAAPEAAPTLSPDELPGQPYEPGLGVVVQDGTPPSALTGLQQGGTPMAANVTGNQPIVLRTETAQTKTLKCTDCGAMNYPTEWYCERCGAELASL